MVSQVSLSRCEELALVVTCKLRPALAVGDSSVPSTDPGRVADVAAALGHLWLRPAESVAASHLGVHRMEDAPLTLSIRFQNVAAGRAPA